MQGQGFRDRIPELEARGVQVFGVSFDSTLENRAFAEKCDFNYPLLCDTDRAMGLAYGACDQAGAKYAARHTFVIGPDGIIEQVIDTKDPGGQAQAILDTLA